MTNLTDKWRKGELPSGYYYVKNEFGNIFPSDYSEDYDYIGDTVIKDFFTEVSEIKEVLEPVPTFEEWQAKLEENTKLKEELKEICEKYLKIKTTVSAYEEACKDLHAYIKKLKELLKEAKEVIEWHEADCGLKDTPTENVLTKINQVLVNNQIQANTVACNKIQEKNNG